MNMSMFWTVIAASSLACLVTTIGIFVISRYGDWGTRNATYFMSFAAGVLISVSFIHIIPESFQMNERAPTYLLAGFLGIYVTNRFLNVYICRELECERLALGIIPMLGIGFHSFVDGLIYAVTFNVSVLTGALAAIGMVLHEFPEGIVTFVLLNRSGLSRKRSALYAFIAAALTTPLGALVSYPFIERISDHTLGLWLALSAGALVYVGASHLLPAVEKEHSRFSILALAAGVLVALGVVLSEG